MNAGPSLGAPQLVSDASSYVLNSFSAPLAEVPPIGAATWPVSDALGSVTGVTDSTGALKAETAYTPYGSPTAPPGSAFGFTGALQDSTGLVYLESRSLDPLSTQMLSPDRVQPDAPGTAGFNPYGYAAQDPTTNVDPTGQLTGAEWAGIAVFTVSILCIVAGCLNWFNNQAPSKQVPSNSFGSTFVQPPPTAPPDERPIIHNFVQQESQQYVNIDGQLYRVGQ